MESKTTSHEELRRIPSPGGKAVRRPPLPGAKTAKATAGTGAGAKVSARVAESKATSMPSRKVSIGHSSRSNSVSSRPNSASGVDSEDEDREVDEEWENLRKKKNEGEIRVSSNPVARNILKGFRINHMRMRDAETGKVKWKSSSWSKEMFESESEAHVPASILQCRAVAREINFTSDELLEDFRLEQRVFFQGVCMEEWFFKFGFVIPGSTNNWESTIYAAEKSAMLPAHLLSGNVTIETSFYDKDLFVSKSLVRVFYDA